MKPFILILFTLLCIGSTCNNKNKIEDREQFTLNSLQAFAKVYGYVKYFHPSNGSAKIDWNNFSAFGAAKIVDCKTQDELIQTLDELFKPIAPAIEFSKTKQEYDFGPITPKNTEDYKLTYWQHTGVSSANMIYRNHPHVPYKSIRVNQYSEIDEAEGLGYLSMAFDPAEYNAKEIKYTAWVKLNADSKGTGHLLLKIKDQNNSNSFFENMQENPITSSEWTRYEIIGELDDQASKVIIGSYLNGKGTLYLDDVNLSYKINDEWIDITALSNGFESIKIDTLIESTAWGGQNKGYSIKLSDNEYKDGEHCAVIEYTGSIKKTMGESLFDASPSFGELIEQEIAEGVFCQIPLSLYGNEHNTYPSNDNLSKYKHQIEDIIVSPTNLSLRLGNVVNIYNVIQHFYPYFDVVDFDWDKELESALKRSFADESIEDHKITLEKFTSPLQDGHIWIWGGSSKPTNYAPNIQWQWIQDKLIIMHVGNDSLDLKFGDEVTRINNQSAREYFQEINSRLSSPTKGYLNYRAQSKSLLGEKDTQIIIEVNDKQIHLTRDVEYSYAFTEIAIQENLYKLLDDNIYYLNLDRIDMDTITMLLPQLSQSKGIICDFRGYSYSNYQLISHLLKEDVDAPSTSKIPQTIYPDQKNRAGYKRLGGGTTEAKEPYLGDKKIVFIIDGRAISAAEGFMSDIKEYQLATIIGQPTAGTNGNINPFRLLGDINIRWTGMKIVNLDGSQFHGIGIQPDIFVERTIAGVRAGQDEFLEKAIELINQ